MEKEKPDVIDIKHSYQQFSWIDYLVFVIMLAVCGGIGIFFGFVKKQRSTQDYLMGGRNMKLVPVCFSLVASFISGISLLGIPTEAYVYGTSYVFMLIGAMIMSVVITTSFLPVLHELQLTSAYEYLELRFDKRIRIFGSVIFSVYLMAWLPIVIYVPALAFNQVTGVNIHIVTPIVCFVCIFYTSIGGLKAVVWTDVIQTVVMIGAMLLVIIKATIIIGGFGEVFTRNYNTSRIEFPPVRFDLTERHSIWSVTIGSGFYWIGNIAVNQSMLQRFLALPNLKQSKWAVWGFLGGVTLIYFICSYSGLVAYAKYYDCDPLNSKLAARKDQILPLLVVDILGEWKGMPGIFVAGVFSAALSSLSTGLNSMAAVVLEDFWKPFCKELTHRQTQILIRSVVVILGCACVGLVFVVEMLGPVLQLTMSLSSASMGPLAGVFLMGMYLPFIDSTKVFEYANNEVKSFKNEKKSPNASCTEKLLEKTGFSARNANTEHMKIAFVRIKNDSATIKYLLCPGLPAISCDAKNSALTGGIIGLTSAWWVAAHSQFAQAKGLLTFIEKPRFTDNCTYNFEPTQFLAEDVEREPVPYLYRISYLWLTALGCVVSVIVASLISLRPSCNPTHDPKLFAPILKKWLKKRQRVKEIQLDERYS